MLSERLRLARRKSGFSLRQLANELDGLVSAQAIGKYERGEMTPSSRVLIALARALGVSIDFLVASSHARLGEIEFRKHSGTAARERAQVETAVLEHVERYLLIEEILGLDSAAWLPPFPPVTVGDLAEAESAAIRVRKDWTLGEDPIPNMTELLEEKGMKVMLLRLPERVSGLTCDVTRPGAGPVPVVVVNANHPLERRRLTLAHELGHRVMNAAGDLDLEKASNRFAGAFLMPERHVAREVGSHRKGFGVPELVQTKRLYRVSAAALIVRFRDLGIIGQERLAYIFQTIGRGWRREEPEPIEPQQRRGQIEAPQRFQRLCYRALAEGVISESKAAELLQMSVAAIDSAMAGRRHGSDRRQ
jgi:Zn-dependent peptidase ImmA (M78 family)/transcriptional regulator with XRE-family HTH domain